MKKLSTEDAIIIDIETTGLGFDAEIVEFTAICADSGKVIVNELVKPTCSIPAEATAIHGITDEDVKDALDFHLVFSNRFLPLLNGRSIIIYNSDFDTRLIIQSLDKHCNSAYVQSVEDLFFKFCVPHCAMNGFELWKYFFCWAPIGSIILIDECQQIYSTNAGFKMANIHKRPFADFEPHLPQGFSEIFHSCWLTVDTSSLDRGEVDDCQRTRFDEQGRIIYPENFNNAFMEHRHYNWDIVLLTPDFAQIPKELKGVAELAKQHKGKEGIFFSNRKPRILKHDPLRTVTVPSKDDVVYNVHLLYASTVTGQITKSGLDKNIFLNPKFLAAVAIFYE